MKNRLLYSELRKSASELADSLDDIYMSGREIWNEQGLPTLTTHGKAHYEQLEENLDRLTRSLQSSDRPLKAEEIYVLLAACCLHDIGMQLDNPDARERHAQYSYELIMGLLPDRSVRLPSLDSNAQEAIASIARGHWTEFALKLPERDYVWSNQEGRVRLLGLLLAIADLLDLSPSRARFFRSPHLLYGIPAISELHQGMHHLVRGCEIKPENSAVPEDLQFVVSWNDNSEVVREMSEWVLHWFTSQWRQLNELLLLDSGGAIRWVKPWSCATFRAPSRPIPRLSEAAHWTLRAERAEQRRINRKVFADAFRRYLGEPASVFFVLPNEPKGDAKWLSEWSIAHARKHDNVRAARIDIRSPQGPDLPGVIAGLLAQWGQQLPVCDAPEAISRVREALKAESENAFVTIILAEELCSNILAPIVEVLALGPSDKSNICILFLPLGEDNEVLHPLIEACKGSTSDQSRICILFSPNSSESECVDTVSGVEVHRLKWSPIDEEDIREHLQSSWGLREEESRERAGIAAKLNLEPASLYYYIETECRVWHCQE